MFKRLGIFLLDILQTIVLALAIFMVVYFFLMQPHQVRGSSMFPNFKDGEYLLTDKISFRLSNPKRGNVIVFEAPPNRREDFIKRIIALPGEKVSIKEGKVLVNNKQLEETYLPSSFSTQPGTYLEEDKTIELKNNEYFVLGDNRNFSSDSRMWGPIKRDDIIGRAFFVYWPPQQIGIIPGITYAGF